VTRGSGGPKRGRRKPASRRSAGRRGGPRKQGRSRAATSRATRWAGRVALSVAALAVVAATGVYRSLEEAGDVDALHDLQVWSGERVRVEVFNAGGVSGMARAATEQLREAGFDVVAFGNADAFDPDRPSAVIDRVGRSDIAQAVAGALGIDNVQSDPDPNLFVDVTVVLGREWTVPATQWSGASGVDARDWWDPRGWFAPQG